MTFNEYVRMVLGPRPAGGEAGGIYRDMRSDLRPQWEAIQAAIETYAEPRNSAPPPPPPEVTPYEVPTGGGPAWGQYEGRDPLGLTRNFRRLDYSSIWEPYRRNDIRKMWRRGNRNREPQVSRDPMTEHQRVFDQYMDLRNRYAGEGRSDPLDLSGGYLRSGNLRPLTGQRNPGPSGAEVAGGLAALAGSAIAPGGKQRRRRSRRGRKRRA